MSVCTAAELAYPQSQRLGRLTTVGADGQPHLALVGFRYNAEQDAIEIGGQGGFTKRKKYHDVSANNRVAFVVDDVASLNPWRVRRIEIRGAADILPTGGQEIVPGFDPEMFRIRPQRIISWGLDDLHSFASNARAVP